MKPTLVFQAPIATRSGYGDHARDLLHSLYKLDKFDLNVHHDWAAILPRHSDKFWKWSIYHRNAKIISREEAENKYGKIKKNGYLY